MRSRSATAPRQTAAICTAATRLRRVHVDSAASGGTGNKARSAPWMPPGVASRVGMASAAWSECLVSRDHRMTPLLLYMKSLAVPRTCWPPWERREIGTDLSDSRMPLDVISREQDWARRIRRDGPRRTLSTMITAMAGLCQARLTWVTPRPAWPGRRASASCQSPMGPMPAAVQAPFTRASQHADGHIGQRRHRLGPRGTSQASAAHRLLQLFAGQQLGVDRRDFPSTASASVPRRR